MKIIVTDREGIEAGVLVHSPYIVISVHDPDKRPARVRKQPALRAVLVVAFDDAEEIPETAEPGEITLMSPDQAGQVIEFVRKHRPEVGTIVVQCEQGMSRSPAIAVALCRVLGLDDRQFWQDYQPNRHVVQLLLDTWRRATESGKQK
jgi:predicted protein tyrosine phosphatase